MEAGVLNLLLGIGSALLIPIAGSTAKFVSQRLQMQSLKIKGDVWEKTQLVVKTAIYSAEQRGKSGKLTTNISKKNHALKLAKVLLDKQKIKVDPGVLSELIEANIWEEMSSSEEIASTLAESKEELQDNAKPEVPKTELPSDFVGEVIEAVG